MAKDPWVGRDLAGCRILFHLGEGAMASVYKAHHNGLDMDVAIKILNPQIAQNERLVQYFLREARSAAKLHHTNIVQVYHSGKEGDSYFIVMQLIEGRTLREIVKSDGPLSVPQATKFVIDVLLGLVEAHSKEIIHRDIKPSNILVTSEGRAMIVDFGLARSVNEERKLTLTGEVIGTAYFIAPEQALGKVVDGRADLYALGATYYFLLTGRHPFEGQNAVEVIHKQINEPLPSVTKFNSTVPENVSRVIDKLMAKRPEERYESAKAVLEDLYAMRAAGAGGVPLQGSGGLVFTGYNELEDTPPPKGEVQAWKPETQSLASSVTPLPGSVTAEPAAKAAPVPAPSASAPGPSAPAASKPAAAPAPVQTGGRPSPAPKPANPAAPAAAPPASAGSPANPAPAESEKPVPVEPWRRYLALGLYAVTAPLGCAMGASRGGAGSVLGLVLLLGSVAGALASAPDALDPVTGGLVGTAFALCLAGGAMGGGFGVDSFFGAPARLAWAVLFSVAAVLYEGRDARRRAGRAALLAAALLLGYSFGVPAGAGWTLPLFHALKAERSCLIFLFAGLLSAGGAGAFLYADMDPLYSQLGFAGLWAGALGFLAAFAAVAGRGLVDTAAVIATSADWWRDAGLAQTDLGWAQGLLVPFAGFPPAFGGGAFLLGLMVLALGLWRASRPKSP